MGVLIKKEIACPILIWSQENDTQQLANQPNESQTSVEEHIGIPLRISQRDRKSTLYNDFVFYPIASDYNIEYVNNQITFDIKKRKW